MNAMNTNDRMWCAATALAGLVACVSLLSAAPTQDDLLAGPPVGERSEQDTTATTQPQTQPQPQTPPTRELRLTPRVLRRGIEHDPALLTIAATVRPSEEQTQAITAAFKSLRQQQRSVSREIIRRYEAQGVQPNNQEARAAATEEIRQQRLAAVESFMVDVNALFTPEQRVRWIDAQAYIDLMPGPPLVAMNDLLDAPRAPLLGPDEGTEAPAFDLEDTTGETYALAQDRETPLVLEFGSLSSPVFRAGNDARRAVQEQFGDAAHWVTVYTREARPIDGTRALQNATAGIEIAQHDSWEARVAAAEDARERLGLRSLVLVDDMNDTVATMYAGLPNRCYVIDTEGKIMSKQLWFDADVTRAALERLIAGEGQMDTMPEAE